MSTLDGDIVCRPRAALTEVSGSGWDSKRASICGLWSNGRRTTRFDNGTVSD